VVLRRLSVTDLVAFQAYRSDAELSRYQGWSAMPDPEARAFLDEMNAAPLFRPGEWAQIGIAEPQTLALLCDIGLHLAEDSRQAEIGFTLARHAQRRGLATRSAAGSPRRRSAKQFNSSSRSLPLSAWSASQTLATVRRSLYLSASACANWKNARSSFAGRSASSTSTLSHALTANPSLEADLHRHGTWPAKRSLFIMRFAGQAPRRFRPAQLKR
jgi:Acetyltransferase (GNAT) domain